MSKAKDKVEVVKINSVNDEIDEVFFYREQPYLNRAEYVKAGTHKLGTVVDETEPVKAKE